MPSRLPRRPERDQQPPEDREAYDFVMARVKGLSPEYEQSAGAYHGALLNSPQLALGLNTMGRVVRTGSTRGSYSDAERELADVVLSKDFGYNGVLPIHLPDAFAVGVRPDAIDAIRAGRDDELTADERQLVEYIRAVATGGVDDAMFAAITARFGLRGAVDYTGFVAFLVCTIRMWQALGMPGPSDAEIDAQLRELRSGQAAIPDPAAHLG
jgi:hypothetical protein